MYTEILKNFVFISLELTALFVVVSFAVNLLQGLIPYEKIEKSLLSTNFFIGSLSTVVLAFITPFCSCSTIPFIVNMLNKKIRFAFIMIFLFASPVLDPTIVTLMIAVMGWKVAVVYTIVTSILSIIIGYGLEKFGFESSVKKVIMRGYHEQTKKFDVRLAWSETMTLMKTVYPYLLLGAAIGSFIQGAVPTEFITTYFGGNQWWLVPIAAVVGIPLYIRLSTMIPISQILIAKGIALGPVMALMISSTGASLPEVTLLGSIFHKRLVFAFVASVVLMSTISGLIFYLV